MGQCTVAEHLAQGQVLGWVQGRSEFGPRALGNRSILADPRPAENKARINEMVKKREGYRPFAPAVLQERLSDFFEVSPGIAAFPFMIFTLPVRAHERANLGAVTHVDGSARVQTVCPETNSRFHELITVFGRLTGIPILLNTSFNNDCEPIVETVDDAVTCFLTTDIDRLAVGDFMVEKTEIAASGSAFLGLTVEVPPTYRLTQQTDRHGAPGFALEFTGSGLLAQKRTGVSELALRICANTDPAKSLGDRCNELGVTSADELRAAAEEFNALWAKRVVRMRPLAK
jgi:carbamoyltransferase